MLDYSSPLHIRCRIIYVRIRILIVTPSNETKPSKVYGTSIPAVNCTKLPIKVHRAVLTISNETKPSNVYGTSTPAVNCTKLPIKVQKAGIQNREDGVLLEKGGSASVRYWYTRTVLSKFTSYSMSNKLQRITSLSKSAF